MAKTLSPFVHLRTHSAYSLLEGAIHIPHLVKLCRENMMPALALTDSGNLFGLLEFSLEASYAGVQPIVGVEISLHETKLGGHKAIYSDAVLLAKNPAGYAHLLKLVSNSHKHSPDTHHPTISLEDIEAHHEGLIMLTGGANGILGQLIQRQQHSAAKERLEYLLRFFDNNLYIELQRHGLDEEKLIEPALLELATEYNVPVVATNNVYFANKSLHTAHDALICIADGRFVMEEERRRFTPEHYFKSGEEMQALFKDIPEAIANTHVIAKRCCAIASAHAPMLPAFTTAGGRTQEEELRHLSETGLQLRLGQQLFTPGMTDTEKQTLAAPYFERLDYEYRVIAGMDFSGYFLIVSDFIRWAKQQGIPVGPGRGSGAGSVIAWALQITNLDPLRFGLLFERFLNPERVSMPDFDIDFCQERRDEVIRYVQQRYGEDRVAQIITFGKLQARAVLRDVGRVLQMSYNHVDKICKMIPFNPLQPVTLKDAIGMDAKLREERDKDEEVQRLLDISLKLEGLYRHASTHAAGIVIGDRPLDELIPVYYDPRSSMPVTGYSMKMAEKAGLVKFDFLGLKTLTVIERSCRLIREHKKDFDIETIPFDDKATFVMLSQGLTIGVFQMESAGMRDALRKMRPDTIEDIIALISLYRPGPMENIPTYINRKHGKEPVDCLHPKLEGILKETFGVMIYQEQVMQIAQVLAGYSLGSADLLRRAMGKKIKEEMDAQREQFVSGAVKNGVDSRQASTIFDLVAKFAGYGFNKSHAAAYAVIGYQTAYLKANYPVEFLTASMNIDIGDTDKINVFRQEATRQQIQILPPDINASHGYFTVEELQGTKAIRYGLGALKNVGIESLKDMVAEREASGAFTDVFDWCRRCDSKAVNKRQLESLAKSGAFDAIHGNRRQLCESAALLTRYNQSVCFEKTSNQHSLFGEAGNSDTIPLPILTDTPDWGEQERLNQAFQAIGFYLGEHPLDIYAAELALLGIIPMRDLEERIAHSGATICMAGVVTSTTHRASGGRRFSYAQLSDPTGASEIAIFDEALLDKSRDLLDSRQPLVFVLEARKDEGGVRLFAKDILPLETHLRSARAHARILLDDNFTMNDFAFLQPLCGQGNATITFVCPTQKNIIVEITLPGSFPLDSGLLSKLTTIACVQKVETY